MRTARAASEVARALQRRDELVVVIPASHQLESLVGAPVRRAGGTRLLEEREGPVLDGRIPTVAAPQHPALPEARVGHTLRAAPLVERPGVDRRDRHEDRLAAAPQGDSHRIAGPLERGGGELALVGDSDGADLLDDLAGTDADGFSRAPRHDLHDDDAPEVVRQAERRAEPGREG
jgi:hypothetical protein